MARPSKVDIWIAFLLVAGPLVLINLGMYLHSTGMEPNGSGCLVAGITVGVVTWLLAFPCQYTLEEERLLVQAGLLKWRIPYSDIDSAELSNSLLSGPALSRQRIEVRHAKGRILISPNDRESFLAELKERLS